LRFFAVIASKLGLSDHPVTRWGFDRPNLLIAHIWLEIWIHSMFFFCNYVQISLSLVKIIFVCVHILHNCFPCWYAWFIHDCAVFKNMANDSYFYVSGEWIHNIYVTKVFDSALSINSMTYSLFYIAPNFCWFCFKVWFQFLRNGTGSVLNRSGNKTHSNTLLHSFYYWINFVESHV